MVGSGNGNLYQITTSNATVNGYPVGAAGGTASGIIAPPIVDVTNGTTFVIDANTGFPGGSAVLAEFNTSTVLPMAVANIGLGSAGGTGTKVFLHQPTFSNNYYDDPNTGFILTCGTGASDTTPYVYGFTFTGVTMNTSPFLTKQLSTAPTGDNCEGWTEFFNPNIGGGGGTDFFFSGLGTDCLSVLGTSGVGCVISATIAGSVFSPTSASVNGGPSGIVV